MGDVFGNSIRKLDTVIVHFAVTHVDLGEKYSIITNILKSKFTLYLPSPPRHLNEKVIFHSKLKWVKDTQRSKHFLARNKKIEALDHLMIEWNEYEGGYEQ